jgi:glycosyltransferase involved in cell wall biosynthesis
MGVPFDVLAFASKEWDSHRQRPHWIADELAGRGANVLFVENLGVRMPRTRDARHVIVKLRHWARTTARARPVAVQSNLSVDAPLVIPFQQWMPARKVAAALLTRRLRRRLTRDRPLVVWTYLPMPVIRDVAQRLGAALVVYDWADDAAAHALTPSPRHRQRLARWEDEMARAADLTFFSGAELLRRRGAVSRQARLIPHGVAKRTGDGAAPPALAGLPAPRVGYLGTITEFTDLELLHALASARPEWSFVLAGPSRVRAQALRALPNVTFTGELPHGDALCLLDSLDAAVIPYRVNAATEAASPVKVREYLAAGLPVVSVDIPEVRHLAPDVVVASDAASFLAALDIAVRRGRIPTQGTDGEDTWSDRVDQMVDCILEALAASDARA